MGKEVISSDAIIIGTVDGVAVDTDNWKMPAIRISVVLMNVFSGKGGRATARR